MIPLKTKDSSGSQEGIPGWCGEREEFLGLQGAARVLRHHLGSLGKYNRTHGMGGNLIFHRGGVVFLATSVLTIGYRKEVPPM